MLAVMSRDHAQTVTHLPVLVEVDQLKEADGRGNFLPDNRAEESAVRIVRAKDIKTRLPKIFPPKELDLFLGAIQLEQALGARDDLALQRASEKVRPWLRDFVGEIPVWQMEIDTKHSRVSRKPVGVNRPYAALLNYCRLMADRLKSVRLVMWFAEKEGRFLPALYCPDWKTAAFAFTFTGGIRVCQNPKCSKVFVGKDNVTYCKPPCREAHRVARWRHRQELKKKAGR
jgi:hypothetical protein